MSSYNFSTTNYETIISDINDNKNKVLEEAKQLTGEQLIEKLKTDSTLKNILLK